MRGGPVRLRLLAALVLAGLPLASAVGQAAPAPPESDTGPDPWAPLLADLPDELPPMPRDGVPLNKGMVIGSWAPDPELGFDRSFLDEARVVQVWTWERVARRTWRGMVTEREVVPMESLLADREGPAIGYVFSLFARRMPDPAQVAPDAPAVLHLRHRGRARVWVDGRQVLDVAAPAARNVPGSPDIGTWSSSSAPIVLTGPYDIVLVKVARGSEELGPSMEFELRISDLQGRSLPDTFWNTMRTPGWPSDLPEPEPTEPSPEVAPADDEPSDG